MEAAQDICQGCRLLQSSDVMQLCVLRVVVQQGGGVPFPTENS
jgi:hypothetical protein